MALEKATSDNESAMVAFRNDVDKRFKTMSARVSEHFVKLPDMIKENIHKLNAEAAKRTSVAEAELYYACVQKRQRLTTSAPANYPPLALRNGSSK